MATHEARLPWPSLYDPGVEIIHIQHNSAIQPEGSYLHHAIGQSPQRTPVGKSWLTCTFFDSQTYFDSRFTGPLSSTHPYLSSAEAMHFGT
jgi:hypothetical protein